MASIFFITLVGLIPLSFVTPGMWPLGVLIALPLGVFWLLCKRSDRAWERKEWQRRYGHLPKPLTAAQKRAIQKRNVAILRRHGIGNEDWQHQKQELRKASDRLTSLLPYRNH